MELTLQEVLVRTLKKLEESSFQRFIEELSVWEVREEYTKIPKDELTGKDPEHVVRLIIEYYKYAYGAEVTLAVLEDIDEKKVREELHHDLREAGDHFIDRHKQDLIDGIKNVDPVISDLYENNLLTEEERDNIMRISGSKNRMRRLYDIIIYWDDSDKEKFYDTLYKYNSMIADSLRNLGDKIEDNKGRLYDIIRYLEDLDGEKIYNTLFKYNPWGIDVLNKPMDPSKLENDASQECNNPLISNSEDKEDVISCKLCDQLPQDSAEIITPTITGSTYRLSMDSPGLFFCSESGIQFQVTQPVTIEYEVDSWSNYTEILQNLRGGYQIIGPLFNIKSGAEPNVVSEVYLPHCLCLEGCEGYKSLIRCFHYKDDNMAIETPSRMEPIHVVLKNPTFSSMGVILYPLSLLKDEIIKRIPYHGMALLFFKTTARDDLKYRYRLHLYLLPRIRTVEKDVERRETRYSFQRIHKPHQTECVYTKKKYRINGPQTSRVLPKMLQFEGHCSSEIYPFTEIDIEGEKNTVVDISILPEDNDVTVWETVVTAEDMLDSPSATPRNQPGECRPIPEQSVHFVDEHRADLIRMISVVDEVLDDLLALNLLTYEQYNSVLIKDTSAEQMRKLYDYIRAWGNDDKDKVYNALKKHNYPIIRKLENKFPAEYENESHKLTGLFKCNLY